DPSLVDSSLKEEFDQHGAPKWLEEASKTSGGDCSTTDVRKLTAALKYMDAIRRLGHREADIYAVGGWDEKTNLLNPETYNITNEDLKDIPASWVLNQAPAQLETAADVVEFLLE